MREYQRSYKVKHKERYRRMQKTSELKKRYNLTYEEYEQLLKDQDGKCAICNEVAVLRVDHEHTSGKIRGLLCNSCNLGLGLFKDNPKLLQAATEYVS